MSLKLEDRFIKLVEIVIQNTITDIHIGSGACPYTRIPSRDIIPVEEF